MNPIFKLYGASDELSATIENNLNSSQKVIFRRWEEDYLKFLQETDEPLTFGEFVSKCNGR